MNSTDPVTPAVISARAYQIWEQCDRPEGCAEQHWNLAEQELSEEASYSAKGSTEERSVEPPAKTKSNVSPAPYRANYAPPSVTTHALHHHRKK